MSHDKTYYSHIDGLRALAVIAVFLSHLDVPLFSGGFIGVDVFFVISGFLITNIITTQLQSSDGFSFLNFYERRIRRIFPALLVTLFCSFIAAIILLNVASFKVFGRSLSFAALSASNIFFNKQAGYFDIFSQSNPLLHTWSLGVEEQFYIVYPIILFTWHTFSGKNALPLYATLFIISLTLNLFDSHHSLAALYYLTPYRAFEFCIGAAIVCLIQKPHKVRLHPALQELLCLLGFGLILLIVLKYNSKTFFPSYNALLPCLGAALIIYTGHTKYTGSILRYPPLRYLGLISYSLYLVHWPLITFYKAYNQNCGQNFAINLNQKIIIIVMSFGLAAFMYHFIEKPFRTTSTKQQSNRKNSLLYIANGLTFAFIVTALGSVISFSKGWVWRSNFANELKKIDDLSQYHKQNWGGADYTGGLIYEGTATKPQIIMMGDSHSGMLDEGIVQEIAKPYGLTVFTASGGGAGKYATSLLLPGLTRLAKDQKLYDDSAKTAYKEVLKVIKSSSTHSVVLVSASWASQLSRAGFLNSHESINIQASRMSSYKDYQPLTTSLDTFLTLLGDTKLIIVGDVPRSRYRPIECLGQLKWFSPKNCPLTDNSMYNKAALNTNKILSMYANKHPNVYFLNPYDAFCKEKRCNNISASGVPYYSDGSHLSKTGSRFLISYFKPKILKVLNS